MKETRGDVPVSDADGVRWVREPAMGRRAGVRHARSGCIWGLGICQGQRQRIFPQNLDKMKIKNKIYL